MIMDVIEQMSLILDYHTAAADGACTAESTPNPAPSLLSSVLHPSAQGVVVRADRASDGQVIAPSSGGPAEAAGVASKDVLQAVDGTSTTGLSLFDVGDMLQGPEGSQVRPARCLLATESGHTGSQP